MNDDVLSHAQHLSDEDLLTQVRLLAHQEREATAILIAHLAVLDERRLYLGQGCSSLFTYCTQVLHLSEHAAYGRIEAARAARTFPLILPVLADGSVTLTTVCLLAPHLTLANHRDLLAAARHKSKREVEDLVAPLRPKSSIPSTVRMLPALSAQLSPATLEESPIPETAPAPMPPTRRPGVEPLGSRQYRVQFTASAETCDKLRLAQDLLRHQIPDGDLGEIMDRALTLLVETLATQKFAAARRPRERPTTPYGDPDVRSAPGSRHIPAEVKRAVWLRDSGRCAFVAPTGRRCTARGFLEFHHLVPYAAGGEASAGNIQLRCRAHNGYEAMLWFGPVTPAVIPLRPGAAPVRRPERHEAASPHAGSA